MTALLLALALSMWPADRATYNATITLHAIGVWGVVPRCTEAFDGAGDYVCVARTPDAYVVLRCSGARAEVCNGRVVRP